MINAENVPKKLRRRIVEIGFGRVLIPGIGIEQIPALFLCIKLQKLARDTKGKENLTSQHLLGSSWRYNAGV